MLTFCHMILFDTLMWFYLQARYPANYYTCLSDHFWIKKKYTTLLFNYVDFHSHFMLHVFNKQTGERFSLGVELGLWTHHTHTHWDNWVHNIFNVLLSHSVKRLHKLIDDLFLAPETRGVLPRVWPACGNVLSAVLPSVILVTKIPAEALKYC